MNTKYFVSAVALSAAAFSAQAQTGIAFITDVKGEAALDANKASLMAEIKKGGPYKASIRAFFAPLKARVAALFGSSGKGRFARRMALLRQKLSR